MQDPVIYLQSLLGKIDDDLNRVKAVKVNGKYEMPYIMNPPEEELANLDTKSKITDI